jgi:hypothetical protein
MTIESSNRLSNVLLLILLPIAWLIALIVCLSICVLAARGDGAQEHASPSHASPSRPLPVYRLSRTPAPPASQATPRLRLLDARRA